MSRLPVSEEGRQGVQSCDLNLLVHVGRQVIISSLRGGWF